MNCRISIIFILVLFSASFLHAGEKSKIISQKSELSRLRKQVKDSRHRLDSLQAGEQSLQRRIGEQDQKMASDRKLINRLNREMNSLKKQAAIADSQLMFGQELLNRKQRRFLGNIRQFYLTTRSSIGEIDIGPDIELDLLRHVIYLKALAGFEQENVAEASKLLDSAELRLGNLYGKREEVHSMRKRREVSLALEQSKKRKGEKELGQIRRKTRDEVDRIMTLEKAAEDMADIIARLEEERARRERSGSGSSFFAALKGQLRAPVSGEIILSYGRHIDKVTKLESFSPGITIKAQPGRKVYAVASGRVAYAGYLRGYGNFVILDHDGKYFTTYAGLEQVTVQKDVHIGSRMAIGIAGTDGLVRFELRRGRETLDPVEWINIESL